MVFLGVPLRAGLSVTSPRFAAGFSLLSLTQITIFALMKNSVNLNFTIGDKVLILNNPNNDETFNIKFSGQEGIVKYLDYDCGCGQTYPNDPMIGVEFTGGEKEEYWKEELMRL